jgi:RNA polymerase sigma-70 factor (ECF subfamily)
VETDRDADDPGDTDDGDEPAPGSASASGGAGLDRETALRLVLEQEPLLVGYARAIVGARDVAEDIFQDLVMLVMRKHGDIPNQQAVPGWTRRATRFLALKRLQKQTRERPVMDDDLVELIDREWADMGLETGDQRYVTALARCREQLPAKSLEMLRLRYDADLSCQEIAERLSRPLNTVYVTITRLHRALEKCIRLRVKAGDG